MGGFFGVASKTNCTLELFYGVDYHSHLGTRRGGMATYGEDGFSRAIHNIENTPFRTKFDKEVDKLFLNFSDPWPKKRQINKRLTSPVFLEKYDKLASNNDIVWHFIGTLQTNKVKKMINKHFSFHKNRFIFRLWQSKGRNIIV